MVMVVEVKSKPPLIKQSRKNLMRRKLKSKIVRSLLKCLTYGEEWLRYLIDSLVEQIKGRFNFAIGEGLTIDRFVLEGLVGPKEI